MSSKSVDFSKFSDEDLQHYINNDYSKLSDAALNQIAMSTPVAEKAPVQEEIGSNRGIGASLGALVGGKYVAPAVAGKYTLSEVLNRMPTKGPSVTVEAAPAAYNTPHGVGTGAVANAEHNVGQVLKNRAAEAALKTPGYVSPGNSAILMPESVAAAETAAQASKAAQAAPVAQGTSALGKAKDLTAKYGKYLTPTGIPGKVLNTVAPIASLAGAGAQTADMLTRFKHNDYGRGIVSGIGALGSAASAIPHPATRLIGTGLGMAAPAINYGLDKIYGREYAQGGLVYLAEGGESNTGPFIGYPQINNKPRDPNFKQQTGPALGYLDAMLGVGQREDISPLNPKDSAYMDAYSKAEPYGILAGVLPFGGMTKAVKGAKKALQAGDIAEHILSKKGMIPTAAHEIGGSEVGKMSDWAQNRIGQFIVPTQADRMGGVGGPSYSANQLLHPQYENRAWGSGQPGTATAISNLAKDPRFGGTQNQVFAPLLGKDTMHQSNQIVFDTMVNEFYKHPEKLTPELRAKINDYLQTGGLISGKTKGFDPIPGFDIADRAMVEELGKTFKNRGLIAQHAFGGEGIGKRKAQIIPYEDILLNTMDPTTKGAKPFSLGPRAFQLSGEVEAAPRPDLNRAYPFQLHGKDLGVTYQPVPSELSLMDFQNQWRKDTGKTTPLKSGALPQPGYFEHTVGYKLDKNGPRVYPRQQITEDWIKELQRSGFAEGGLVDK